MASNDDLELNMRVTVNTEEISTGTKEIENSINKMEETNKSAHEQIQSQTEKTGGLWTKVFNLSNAVSLVKNGAGMIIGAIQSIGAVLMDFRDAADDQADAIDGVNLQLKNMGIYTDELSEQLQDHAKALEQLTNYSDQAILEGDKMLLTFENLSGDIMPRATEAMLDMSAVMGTDLKSSAQTIGKALQDPINGLGLLSKQGFKFTEQQKESIAMFVKQNDIISAQGVILDSVALAYGGHAKLQVDAVEQAKNAWTSLKEVIGGQVNVLGSKLQPAIDSVFGAFKKLTEAVGKFLISMSTTYWLDKTKEVMDFAIAVDKVVGKVLWFTVTFDKLGRAWGWFTNKLATADIKGQASNFEMLSSRLLELKSKTTLTTTETALYHETIKRLQNDYGEYLKNVNLEKDSYDKVAESIRNASAALQKNSAIKLAQLEIDEIVKKAATENAEKDKKLQKEYDKKSKVEGNVWIQAKILNTKGKDNISEGGFYTRFTEADYKDYTNRLQKIIDAKTGYTEKEKELAKSALYGIKFTFEDDIKEHEKHNEKITKINNERIDNEANTQKKIADVLKKYGVTDSDIAKPEVSTGTIVGGGGDGDNTEKKLNTEMSLEQQIKEIEKQAEVKKVSADEYEKKIIDINTKRDIAILKEEMRVKDLISEIKAKYELTKDMAEKEKLQKEVDKLSNETIDKKAAINKKAEEDIKAIKDNAKAEAEAKAKAIQEAKKAEAEAEKKENEKYEQDKEARIAERERQREQQRERAEQYRNNTPEKRLERGEVYASSVVGLTDPTNYGLKDKELAELQTFNDAKKKLFEDELSYKEIHNLKLAESDKKNLEAMKVGNSMQMSILEDKKKFQNMLGNTATGLADKLISGEIKSGKQMKELMKTNMKAFLVDSGQRHAHKALEEGAEAMTALAAHDAEGVATHTNAAIYHAGVATAAGIAANAIKTPSSTSTNNNNQNNLPGSAVSAEKKKELIINTDNQAIIRMLIPEFAQALDDGYSISKK